MTRLTPESVLAWARTKPADEAYEYENSAACALCRFLKDSGAPAPWVTAKFWHGSPCEPLRDVEPALNEAAAVEPHTFGAFVVRLEGLCDAADAAALRPFGLSQSTLSQAEPAAAIAECVR